MIEPNSIAGQTSVLDDVRRALGRSTTRPTVPPSPLAPFIESAGQTGTSGLIARFTAEATAVRAKVHRVSDKLQFVDQLVELCTETKEQEIALSGAELFA